LDVTSNTLVDIYLIDPGVLVAHDLLELGLGCKGWEDVSMGPSGLHGEEGM
jgi:hypothetical protein